MTDLSTVAYGDTALGRFAEGLLRRAATGIDFGHLRVILPSGRTLAFGRAEQGLHATLHIHSWNLLWRLVAGWDIGFAESYFEGEWSSPHLPTLLELLSRNDGLATSARALGFLRPLTKLHHLWNRNTRRGSRRNIAAHYDLGNAFYEQWLDSSLTYSSAIYSHKDQTLEAAQQEKLGRIMSLLELTGEENVLEIGCGWGALAERILEQHDGNYCGLTLSAEQLAYSRKRLRSFESTDRCDLRLQDYRDIAGTYDRIVSIEMLEAVGESYWPAYFSKLRESLSRDGVAVLQVITIDEAAFANYRRYPDFIQRYIFPGGMLPTVEIIKTQIERAGLRLVSQEFFGLSYARTLSDWRRSFRAHFPAIEPLGFDSRFQRMWDYYLAYCQAGFDSGRADVGLYKLVHTS